MNKGDLRQFIKDELSTIGNGTGNDPFFTNIILDRFINRAVKWVSDQHFWNETEKSMRRNTTAGQEYYTIPEKFKPISIKRIQLDTNNYKIIKWDDYQNIQNIYGDGGYTRDILGIYSDKLFLNPKPKTDGVNNLTIWGQEVPTDMVADSDTHPFTRTPRLEQAVLEYALYLCYRKKRGKFKSDGEASLKKALIEVQMEWSEQKKQRSYEDSVTTTQFEHIDFLSIDNDSRRTDGRFTL